MRNVKKCATDCPMYRRHGGGRKCPYFSRRLPKPSACIYFLKIQSKEENENGKNGVQNDGAY